MKISKNIIVFIAFLVVLILLAAVLLLNGRSKNNTLQNATIPIQSQQNTNQNINSPQLSKEESYCINHGGKIGEKPECSWTVATCIFKEGTVNESECPLSDYFKGYCEEGVIVEWGEACRGE